MTTPPDSSLFFHRGEPGDPRLGETVLFRREDYDSADVVLLGCPQDEGVRRNGGRPGAAKAPDAIRKFLYRLIAPPDLHVYDIGNTPVMGTLEEMHNLHEDIVERILFDGKRLVVLGGGNDISYPDCHALSRLSSNVLVFNIDSHLDVRENAVRNSGTPYRMLLEECVIKPELFHEVAYQPWSVAAAHLNYVRAKGAHATSLEQLRQRGLSETIRTLLDHANASSIFWGLDMDSVRAGDAPGVSAPNPLGLTAEEVCQLAAIAGADLRSRIFEITEVNPNFDIDDRTARLAALAIFYFLRRQA